MLTFAGCSLDLAGRVLLRDGRPEHLEPQAFDVLAHLLLHRERVVPKEELLDIVWGGRWITTSALTTRIKELRRATGDDGDAQVVIRTVRGRGYQLVATVTDDNEPMPSGRALVGRDRDLAELDLRIRPGSLVTLVGPGGVGKTSLGRQTVARAAGRFVAGAVLVDLTVLEEPSQLLAAVARAADVVDVRDAELVDALSRLDAVLLLDDADDLVADVAGLCDQLFRDGSRIAIVVTSRERLGVRGEQLWPVLPLSATAARELLVARSQELAPLGSLHDMSLDEQDSLTESVDRLPLAVEMLAGMSAVLSVAELHEVVGRRLDLITTVHRQAPERHRSLDRLVQASLSRLDDRARKALTAVTSFAGAFTATDATRLISDDGDRLGTVRELVDRSLLSPVDAPGGARFQMLRTVQLAVRARADGANLDDAARRHAEFVTQELKAADAALRGADEVRGAAAFERLTDEARAAHAWARRRDPALAVRLTAALHLYSYSRMWAEPAAWAAATIEDGQHVPGAVLAALATQAAQDGRFPDAVALADRARADESDLVQGSALETLSDVAIYMDHLERAETCAQELIALGRACRAPRMVAIGMTNVALARVYSERPAAALELLDHQSEGLPLGLAPSERAWLAFARGEALATIGDELASPTLIEAVRLGDSVGNRFVAGMARASLGSLQSANGDLAEAAATYTEILESFVRHGNTTHLTVFLRNTVPLMARLGETGAASVVGSWVFGPHGRTGHGLDVRAAHETLDELRAQFGAEQMAAWAREGRDMTAAGAAEHALSALRAHAAPG